MSESDILLLIGEQYLLSYNSNGVHVFKMYFHKNKMIKYHQYLSLQNKLSEDLYILSHVGMRQQLTQNFWLFTLFTSKSTTMLNDNVVMNNIQLYNNIHKFVNPIIIISNSNFSDYVTISNLLSDFPKYQSIKQWDALNQSKMIIEHSVKGFKLSVEQSNFNTPT